MITNEEALVYLEVDSTIWPLPLWDVAQFREVVRVTKLAAIKEFLSSKNAAPLAIRNLAASDLGLTPRHWNEQTSGTFNAWENSAIANQPVADATWIGIFGAVDLSTDAAVSAIRVIAGGAQMREWDLQACFNPNIIAGADLSRIAIASSPIIIGENRRVTIQQYTRGATNADARAAEVMLLGIVVEQTGGVGGLTAAVGG